ncbi:MAG: asparagine synthase (glutamine-hydrolyzing) [Candidatus Aminicenantes bacterium]|nr:asparagine synthase (glutamine-hydrolyzing) [Candidatus Aminicenantes bacterium]
MCGICGIIQFNQQPVHEASIRNMMQIMKHRGPDDEGVFIEKNVGLGFVRLSIIDLSKAGNQPMVSFDNRYMIVFNGEIYNYIEIREDLKQKGCTFRTNSDTEVLLAAYMEWGGECLHRFNGMWAFVIYDRFKKKIFAARDRYGIKPFYYLQTVNRLAFASEIPPLLSLLERKPSPDQQSIFDYLVFNRTDQTERTFFDEIKKLQHGHSLNIELSENREQKTEVRINKWYDLRSNLKEPFKTPEEFKEMLSSAVGLRLRSDVPVGVCLSGGLDSSSIVSILLKDYKKKDLNTFSAVYEKGQFGDETEYINEYKPFLKNMFFTTPSAETLHADLANFVTAHAEPIPSTSPYAQFKVMELAKGKVVVTLDGQGADEELAGYHYFFGFFFKDLFKQMRLGKLSYEMIHYLINHHSFYGLKTFLYFLLPEKSKTRLRVDEKGYLTREFVEKHKSGNSIAGNLYNSGSLHDALLDHFEYKLEHLLKWEDRNSMWFSLEARVPFLDYRLVEKILATSGDLIIKNGMTKHLLRESMKGILPEKIRMRRDKVGFETPQDEWFKMPAWRNMVSEILNSRSFAGRGIIDPVEAMKTHNAHISGKTNASKEIWKWVHLELWHREFIDA